MKHVIDFMRSATKSGVYLYREIALSAFELVPALDAALRVSSPTRPWSEIRASLAVAPSAVPLQRQSPQSL